MMFRKIQLNDYLQYCKLINSTISQEKYNNFLQNILNDKHIILVVEKDNNLIGTGTLLIEEKMTYGGCKMGHIENVLVDENYRGYNIGINLVNELLDISKSGGCYRTELNCSEELIKFYEKNNLYKHQVSMSIFFKENFK